MIAGAFAPSLSESTTAMRFLPLLVVSCFLPGAGPASAAPYFTVPFLPVSETAAAGSLALAADGRAASIYHDAADAAVVGIAANALRDDIQRVTGLVPAVATTDPAAAPTAVFIGTVGRSRLIDGLVAAGKLDVAPIQGQWEAYTAAVVADPAAGVGQALVVAGSDRRGTAFGVFALSEAIGVSPWYWWGDVPVAPKPALHVGGGTFTAPSPGVKYRGIFLNDEDWGLYPWAAQTFDPAGDVGPATYARVCELLLRLHANYLWPAMHEITAPFYTVPGNMAVADNYAIVVGTSHHEPMLRNTAEYDEATMGPYNYWTNRDNIRHFWEQRVVEAKANENIYTVGMRALWDSAMQAPAGTTTEQKRDMLQNSIIPDQRQMVADHVNPNPALVPQAFVPYNEALLLYQAGLQLPDDITLLWVDDNHGYLRQLSNPAERARAGGSGVYYHISYYGPPGNFLWLCTTPPALTWAEMSKAWDYGARQIWIVNVGDLKPMEIGTEFFLRLARNPEAFRDFDQHAYHAQWAERTFGPARAEAIASLLDEYFRLNLITRPEHLNRTASGFSFTANGDEAQQRLDEFAALAAAADALYAGLPANQQPAFYEMVLYPIRGSNLVNRKVLLAERSRLWARQGRAATTTLAADAQAAQSALQAETTFYNETNAGGKWNRMIVWSPTGPASGPFVMPAAGSYTAPAAAGLGVAVEGSEAVLDTVVPGVLPVFNPVANRRYFVDVFNTGGGTLSWSATASEPWVTLSQDRGTADARIWAGIDWTKAPRGFTVPATVTIEGAGATRTVRVKAFNPPTLDPATLPAVVENNGVVTIEAEDFQARQDAPGGAGWRKISRATASRDGMTVLPVTVDSIDPAAIAGSAPSLTYQFHAFRTGYTTVEVACLPTQRITSGHPGCRYAVALNGEPPRIVDIHADAVSELWRVNVLRATANGLSPHVVADPGLQTLRVWMVDPGVVLDKLTVRIQPEVLEVEMLEATHTEGLTYRPFGEVPLSAGVGVALEATAVGDFVTLALPAVQAGNYDLKVRAKELNNRGIIQLALADAPDGPFTDIGDPLDLYSASAAYTEFAAIRIAVATPGTKYLKARVTGKHGASTGYWVALDCLTLAATDAPIATRLEAESLAREGTAGRTLRVYTEATASAGAAVALESTTPGDFVKFTLPGLPPGAYELTVRAKKHNNRAIVRMAVGDDATATTTPIGPEIDLYSASQLYADLPAVRFTIPSQGPWFLKFTVAGRNPASTSSWITVDRLTLVPVALATAYQMPQWRMDFFGTTASAGEAADEADPDADGFANLLEYATGSYPTAANGALWSAALAGNHLALTFLWLKDATDITYRVIASNNLSEKTEIWSSAGLPYPGGAAPSIRHTVNDPQDVAGNPARFLWLRVTRP